MNALDDPDRPLPALTLTIQTAGAPAVQLTHDPDRPIEQTAVTLLDQLSGTQAWFFDDVVADAFVFLLHYVRCPAPVARRAAMHRARAWHGRGPGTTSRPTGLNEEKKPLPT